MVNAARFVRISPAITTAIGIALVVVYAFGSGALMSNTGRIWYQNLNAPSWQPPDFVFGFIWPYNFILLGVSAYTVANRLSTSVTITFLAIFATSVFCALTWAYLFYHQNNLTGATVALALVTLLTIPLLFIVFKASIGVGLALVPYQLWVATATALNFSYNKLN